MEYKLVKWYPSLPEDWDVGMEVGQGERGEFGSFSPCNSGYTDRKLHYREVRTNKDFWEKAEKNYRVASYNCEKHGFNDDPHTFDKLKNKIISVMRVSDGQKFFIGDKVKHKNINKYIFEIDSFYINGDDECIVHSKDIEHSEKIDLLDVIESPLFISEDGVEINFGDTFYVVNSNFRVQQTTGGHFQNSNWDGKRYSNYDDAHHFAILNKPCLSIQDVMGNNAFVYGGASMDKLKEIVKSRI